MGTRCAITFPSVTLREIVLLDNLVNSRRVLSRKIQLAETSIRRVTEINESMHVLRTGVIIASRSGERSFSRILALLYLIFSRLIFSRQVGNMHINFLTRIHVHGDSVSLLFYFIFITLEHNMLCAKLYTGESALILSLISRKLYEIINTLIHAKT